MADEIDSELDGDFGQGVFRHIPGKHEVEKTSSDGFYIHVHHDAYGEYKHVIIRTRGMRRGHADAIKKHWENGRPIILRWWRMQTKTSPGKHSIAIIKSYTLH